MNLALPNPNDIVLGHDFAGIVEEIGPDVPHGLRKVGERIAGFLNGCEFIALITSRYFSYDRRRI